MWVSRNKLEYLENRIEAIEQKVRCKEGNHNYRADRSCSTGKPILLCDSCYDIYKEPTLSNFGKSE